jgi:peptidoglycan/LPS O-acetylase OafA/YrhL
LGGILLAAFTYKMGHPLYPGSAVALPVVSAALVIAGGTAAPKLGAGAFLGLAPVRWLGRLSFSLYLWHFPLLSIASQRWPDPTLARQFSLCGVALVLSALTYYLIENPIRHSQFLKRHAALSIGLAVAVIGAAFGLTFVI